MGFLPVQMVIDRKYRRVHGRVGSLAHVVPIKEGICKFGCPIE